MSEEETITITKQQLEAALKPFVSAYKEERAAVVKAFWSRLKPKKSRMRAYVCSKTGSVKFHVGFLSYDPGSTCDYERAPWLDEPEEK